MTRTVDEIRAERRALLRGNRFLKDDVHRGAEVMLAKAVAYVPEQLSFASHAFLTQEVPSRRTQHGAGLLDLAALWALTRPEFAELIHEAIERAPAPDPEHSWSELTRKQLDAQVARLDAEIAEIELAGKRSELLDRQALLEGELKALKLKD